MQDLQRILTRSLDLLYSGTTNSSGLQVDCDFLLVIKTMETQLLAWHHEWLNLRNVSGESPRAISPSEACLTRVCVLVPPHVHSSSLPPRASIEAGESGDVQKYRMLIANFYFHYAMLTINAFGLQNALERSAVDIGHFFARCHSSAVSCASIYKDEMGPAGFLRHAPDSHFVMGSYAVLSLLKVRSHVVRCGCSACSALIGLFHGAQLIRPEFQAFLDHEEKTIAIVRDVANTFDQVAVGPLHTPALYSCFLRALISARTDGSANQDGQQQQQTDSELAASHDGAAASSSNSSSSSGHAHSHVNGHTNGHSHGPLASHALEGFAYTGEMGPVVDISTFPPTMAPNSVDHMNVLSMDSILSSEFWDSVLVPGESPLLSRCAVVGGSRTHMLEGSSHAMESLSGGFVYGAGGSGFITPRMWMSPLPSGSSSPVRAGHVHHQEGPAPGELGLEGPMDPQHTSPVAA